MALQQILLPALSLLVILLGAISALLFFRNYKRGKKFQSLESRLSIFENICSQANDALFVIDIANGGILKTNDKAAKMLGYSIASLEKMSIFNIHPSEHLNKSSETIADVWEKGGMVYQDIPFITASGELLPVECSAKVLPLDKRPSIVIYARDITKRLRMEKEIREQSEIIRQKNKDIIDSIHYAQQIQEAILPSNEKIRKLLPNSFTLLEPKDIVSGDFYWVAKVESEKGRQGKTGIVSDPMIIWAVADCTGHGVPGAFMSMIGNALLDEIVIKNGVTQADKILNQLRDHIISALGQKGITGEQQDGMDIALCIISVVNRHVIPPKKGGRGVLQYAGAYNPLWIVRRGELIEMKADRQPIGIYEKLKPFTKHEIELQKGDIIYTFSDGYADQFGGNSKNEFGKGEKFKKDKFKELLLSINDKSMKEQKKILKKTNHEWRGNLEQGDDICVVGVRV